MLRRYGLALALQAFIAKSAFAAGGFNWLNSIAHSLHISVHIVTFTMIALIICGVGLVYRSKVSAASNAIIPDKGTSFRNIIEAFGEFIYGLCKNIMGEKEAQKYFSTIAMIFLFIFLSNVVGLVPGFLPPTEDINTTLALGLFVFIFYNYQGIKEQGLVGHIKHFMGPVWYLAILIFPIELISHGVRPLSLALRLRGNMSGDHMVLSIFSDIVPYIVPIVFLMLGLFVCFIQAFVFTLLSMVYISLATEHHDHDEAGAH